MSRSNTAKVTDQLLQDIFDDDHLRFTHSKKKTNRPPAQLQSLTIASNTKPGMVYSQSANNINEVQSFGKNVLGRMPPPVNNSNMQLQSTSHKQLNVEDFNRISDLMHRVVAVSGQSPTKESEKFFKHGYIPSEHPTNMEMAQHMKATQLKDMQESISLKEIMKEVVSCYDELQGVIINHLQFRKEVCTEVQDINRKYIDLFEQMLSNVLHTQRTKFKTQTSTIEDLTEEVKRLTQKLAQETELSARRYAENKELKERIAEVEDQRSTFQYEINTLQFKLAKMNSTEATYMDLAERNQAEFKRVLQETKLAHAIEMEALRYQNTVEVKAIQGKLLASEKETLRIKMLLEKEEAKTLLKGKIDPNSFKRPSRDNESQTYALDNGLFDKKDGWVLPISKNAAARNHWRQALNFAHCRACKGVGKYILTVAQTWKAIQRGSEILPDPSGQTNFDHKWSLPDSYLRFLSNLPKTVQTFNPRSLQWLIRIVTYLYNHKYTVDRQDSSYGYNTQSITEYLIEMFLLKLETRTDAEIGIYRMLITLREYYTKHPMLLVFARFLGILDETTLEEKYNFKKEEMLNEQALARKRESDLQVLKPRHRNKLKDQLKDEQAAKEEKDLRESINNHYVRFVTISYKKLELDILCIYLYARKCLLFDNYSGVYAKAIKEIKAKSSILAHFSHMLIGNVTNEEGVEVSAPVDLNSTQSSAVDAVHTHIFNVFPRDIPVHLCIGEGCINWIPLDRAVRVLRVLTEHLPPEDMMAIYHSLEKNAKFLYPDGRLDLPEGMHTLIRQTARLFVHSVSTEGADIDWWTIYETYQNTTNTTKSSMDAAASAAAASIADKVSQDVFSSPSKAKMLPTKCVVNEYIEQKSNKNKPSKQNDLSTASIATNASISIEKEPRYLELADGSLLDMSLNDANTLRYYNKKHPEIIMVSMDHILQLIVDAMVVKTGEVEKKLKAIFVEGDTNKDGVLSFQEFTTIAQQVAPEFSQRKILKMFREALTSGDDCDFIGPEVFLTVCKTYGLVKLLDIDELKSGKLKAISDPPIAPIILYNNEAASSTIDATDAEANPVVAKVVPVIKKKLHLVTQNMTKLQKVANMAMQLNKIPITSNNDFPDAPESKPNTAPLEMSDDLPDTTTTTLPLETLMTPLVVGAPAPVAPPSYIAPFFKESEEYESFNASHESRRETPDSNYSKPTSSSNSRLNRYRHSNSNLRLHSDSEDEQPDSDRRDPRSREMLRSKSRENPEKSRIEGGIARVDSETPVKRKSIINLRLKTTSDISTKRQQELEMNSAMISESLVNSSLFSSESSPVKKSKTDTVDQNLNIVSAASNAQQTTKDVAQLLKAQHQAMMKNVDVKSLVVNEEASKNSADLFKQQLKQRREARMQSEAN